MAQPVLCREDGAVSKDSNGISAAIGKDRGMNKNQAIAVFAAFTCLDMFEDFLRTALSLQTNDIQLDKTAKQHLYIIDGEWKRLKKYLRKSNMPTQEFFGESAELFKELMLQVMDAGDQKPEMVKMVLDFANKFDKQLNINKKLFGI